MMQLDIQSKFYGDHQVLGAISLNLRPGEVSVFFGPSGCGKSTLLNLICALDRSFEGSIDLHGKRIAMVFQEPRLLPWLTVRQNIELVADAVDVKAILSDVGVIDAIDVLASKLSLGMARRVAFARALSVHPDVLVMDEPFVSLDRERAESMRLMVLDLMEKKACSAIFVTHDLEEAVQLGHRLYVMGKSPCQIVQQKSLELTPEQRRDPHVVHQYAKTFAFS